MAQVSESFQLNAKMPLDSRTKFRTVQDMKNYSASRLYNGIIAVVDENNLTYQYLTSNDNDPDTGKWRIFNTGGTANVSSITEAEILTLFE